MGCWGMGITQSDEFCEVYDRFLEEYDQGKTVVEITEKILSEYLSEFDENDGVLHDVYISTQFSDAIVFGVLIIVLLVKPTGLLGKKIQEKV